MEETTGNLYHQTSYQRQIVAKLVLQLVEPMYAHLPGEKHALFPEVQEHGFFTEMLLLSSP